MKTIGLIAFIVILVGVFGGFWLYRGTMPEIEIEDSLSEPSDTTGNSNFLQLKPDSLPPIGGLNKEQPEAPSESKMPENNNQIQEDSIKVQEEQSEGEVSGATDSVIEESGGESITDVDEPGVVVSMTDLGFFPASISVETGTTVTFINDGQSLHWPASDVHPTHNLLPGFDANKGISTGGVYTYKFTKAGEWSFHDHLNPDFVGSIVVE